MTRIDGAMTSEDLAIGVETTTLAMGMDQFERAQARHGGLLDGEGLVPIYLGDALVPPRAYTSWEAIFHDLAALRERIADRPVDARRVFLDEMASSLQAAARLFSGEAMSYPDKLRELVGAPAEPGLQARIDQLTRDLDAALVRAGVTGADLSGRVHRWEADRAIDPSKLEQVFAELLAAAKARTDAAIFDTGDYEMRLNAVADAPYTARCGFKERRMDLNVDNRFTRAAMKHLVCHEVFPGHATQLLYTLAEVQAGRSPADALLCTANAVTGCVQEGIGDQGVALIDWIEDEDDEIHMLLRTLKSAVQTDAAWRLMVLGEPREAVADYLRTAAFGQEAWVQGRLNMAAHPFRGPFIASYYAGNESVRKVRERVPAADRGAFNAYLYGQVHSPDSLEMFSPQAGRAN